MKGKDCAIYASIEEARTEIVFPYLLKAIGRLKPSRVLDLGCGPGLWLHLAAKELTRTTFFGCDKDPNMRTAALQRANGLPNIPCIVSSTKGIADTSMNVVLHTAVIMTLPTSAALHKFFCQIARMLTDRGIMLSVETHPCFREESYQGFTTNFDDKNYLAPQAKFTVTLQKQGQEQAVNSVEFIDTHRPLMTSFNAMVTAGMQPVLLHEFPDISDARGSPWLLWGATKIGCPASTVRKYRQILLSLMPRTPRSLRAEPCRQGCAR